MPFQLPRFTDRTTVKSPTGGGLIVYLGFSDTSVGSETMTPTVTGGPTPITGTRVMVGPGHSRIRMGVPA